VSCYFRHVKNILDEAGVKVTSGNKKEIDQAFHQIVGVGYKDCPTTMVCFLLAGFLYSSKVGWGCCPWDAP